MPYLNEHTLMGNVGADPVIKYLPSGSAVANFSVATTSHWKDKQSGDKQERTEWHNVVVFGKLAEIIGERVRKGDPVWLRGESRTEKWQDKEGKDRYTVKVCANEFKALKSKPKDGEASRDNPEPADFDSDDIPF